MYMSRLYRIIIPLGRSTRVRGTTGVLGHDHRHLFTWQTQRRCNAQIHGTGTTTEAHPRAGTLIVSTSPPISHSRPLAFITVVATGNADFCRCSEREWGALYFSPVLIFGGSLTGGRAWTMAALNSSSRGGNTSLVPSSSALSSTVKPGGSVAISNRTPPGSLK